MVRFSFLLFAAVICALACTEPATAAACGTPSGRSIHVADIDERLEILLDDGRRLRLAGIETPRATPADPQRLQHTRSAPRDWLTSPAMEIGLELLAASADRWNRHPARLFARSGVMDQISVGEALVDAGLARVEIDPLARPCLKALLALEDGARRARLGIWSDPAYAPMPAQDRAAFGGRAGETVLVQGTVIGTGRTATRIYLNFGPVRTLDFAATIARQNWSRFEAEGVKLEEFTGKSIRLRGLVETQFGPQIEIADPEAIEIVETKSGRPPYSGPTVRR